MFYLIERFGVSTQAAQIYLFIFLAANAVGAFFGGPLGDRFGRKYVIWFSILGALPFTLALPYAGLFASAVLTVFIGLIISSATSSIIVFAQELMPHRFGMISGMFFGVAFGIGGLGAAVLGRSPIIPASSSSIRSARSCRRSGCLRCSCRRCQSQQARRLLHLSLRSRVERSTCAHVAVRVRRSIEPASVRQPNLLPAGVGEARPSSIHR